MADDLTLFLLLLGCTPPGRNIEQHDVLFTVGKSLRDVAPQAAAFWPEAPVHIDAWVAVDHVDGYDVTVVPAVGPATESEQRLYFVNLGGYESGVFEELHEKRVVVAPTEAAAVSQCRRSAFYQRGRGPEVSRDALSHVDDKHAADELIADDVLDVAAQLPAYRIVLTPSAQRRDLTINIGYLPLRRL